MLVQIFQVDAFTRRRFGGNPAAVMILESFLDDACLQDIAAENNLAETAFLVRDGADYRLRWFTPTVEVPLCGHATLASAAVVLERLEPRREVVTFHSASGPLVVSRSGDSYVMDFPARPMLATSTPEALTAAIGQNPTETLVDQHNYLAVLETAEQVRKLAPDLGVVTLLGRAGLIVTAPGDDGYDCVSRYFAPAKGIPEDPVTGGAHCALTPYWANRLGKTSLRAFQASARGGELRCRTLGERVELEGSCVFYLEGQAEI
ncbi:MULTISPECIES: PhzF family phenazine biosynthesis protein [Rhizobium]|uniref:PhzF family phenazine biosynthesis protein n=1 Tax=Rhizobium TaxID=379 RepID=UPI0007EB6A60|nr:MULTISPECIES: PhzF family phenazine biosynthesis protein [Rhizobium]ANK95182.1 phenazine biosynthesis PhzC/PhzF-like protein [Rhizobium sp. N6212]ANL01233.1 phenazine biosynthesis PhzC/PhzF-like protein [Rhizobium sp. N621]ANL07356.1 phenazine biosynthesis PhzC/PhzF-like protein [Rhizobium esperanzae]ANL13526.1 phenazine biosynthesis PhzC/PhzF-like protein [Rhizobium sp. N1341]ANL25512.1 phenazine biosynthesis PhzC/PhzF-like protein [Rhizobium sp. N113]